MKFSAKVSSNRNMYDYLSQCILKFSFRTHLLISIVIRLALIIYSHVHDKYSGLPYTDIDYKVVTDGSRLILEGHSPFGRHTYRYSPILAYIHVLNLLVNPAIGKIIYSICDVLVAMLIYGLVKSELQTQCCKAIKALFTNLGNIHSASQQNYNETNGRLRSEKMAKISACCWLYNPLGAIISTRGNGDSFSSFFVILTVYLLLKSDEAQSRRNNVIIFCAGLAHGFAIHLRVYPLLFSLAYFVCLSNRLTLGIRVFLHQLIFPSKQQLCLIFGTLLGLCVATCYFYHLYGWQYIYEAYIYHFVRKDVRHNFSLYFLMQYLSYNSSSIYAAILEKLLILSPQICLIIYLSLSFGQFRQTLPFCIFALTFVIVTFNSVVTSQYFVWYLSLLPLCLNNFQSFSVRKFLSYFSLWILAQVLWLLPAYLLEFKSKNTFYWIGGQSILFFVINSFLLTSFIRNYSFTSFKVKLKKL